MNAARSVLIELSHLLGAYRNDIVVIGGWVPPLLFGPGMHVGSMAVDLAQQLPRRPGRVGRRNKGAPAQQADP